MRRSFKRYILIYVKDRPSPGRADNFGLNVLPYPHVRDF